MKPRDELVRDTPPRPGAGLRLLLLALAASPIAYAGLRAASAWGGLGNFCPFRTLTGLPCPFCFGTRSWILILQGDLARALITQPLGTALFFADLAAVVWLAAATLLGLRALPVVRWTGSRNFWPWVLALIMASWAYNIYRVLVGLP